MKEKFTLEWKKDFQADGYVITYKVQDEFIELVRIENTDLTTIMLPEVAEGVENHFRVSFYKKKGNNFNIYKDENYYCFATMKKLAIYRFPTPKLKKAVRQENSIIIEWEKVSDKVTYVVARKTPKGKWIRIGMTKETNFTDSKIDISKHYVYTVRCISEDGKENLSSCSDKRIFVK